MFCGVAESTSCVDCSVGGLCIIPLHSPHVLSRGWEGDRVANGCAVALVHISWLAGQIYYSYKFIGSYAGLYRLYDPKSKHVSDVCNYKSNDVMTIGVHC